MHKPESILENETHKILWNLEIQINHLLRGQKTRPTANQQKKKKKERKKKEICHLVDFLCSNRPVSENKESENRDKYLDLA